MKKIGRYEILGEVGRGAMGIVYKASDPTIGRLVAIKVLSLDSSSQEGGTNARESFMREARAAGRLSHPGIVTIHDALEDPETKSSYIVMEFIQGRTLESILVDGPRPSTEQALKIIRQVAEALEYAHQHQILHRDLKPANILVTDDGRAKITDFGIARVMARDGAHRTTSVMGTPAYMSPEQLTGGELDARSDLFSFGVLTYLMLSGEKPFLGDTAAVLFKIVYEDPAPPSQIKPGLAPGHDYLALRSLVKNPRKRYQSAREFLDDLDDVQSGKSPRSEAGFPLSEIRAGDRTITSRPPVMPWKNPEAASAPEKKSGLEQAGMIAAGVLMVAVLVVGFLIYRSFRHPPVSPAAVQPGQVAPATTANPDSTAPAETSEVPNASTPPGAEGRTPGASPLKKEPGGAAPVSKPKVAQNKTNDSKDDLRLPGGKKVAANGAPPATAPASSSKEPPPQLPKTEPTSAKPAKSTTSSAPTTIQLVCRFELKDAALTISNDAGTILMRDLKGKKKSGFLHIKSGYAGTFSQPLNLPAGTSSLSVHVLSTDGAVDLTRKIAINPPTSGSATFQVNVTDDKLNLRWTTSAKP